MREHETKQQKNDTSLSQLSQERATKSNAIEIPQISLPKGGGALKGIDEKFQVNAANGTAGFSIPLPLSPNRNGFTPQMSLSYNSGVGNGLFGIGWDIDLPSIQRRTDKKLPRYFDTNNVENIATEDSFMFSGVEELVPFLELEENGEWKVKQDNKNPDFIVRQYRPRIEGSFSRIERIFEKSTNAYYWKVTSKDNITTFFGYSESCRIADPTDKNKVFQWLPEFAYDDKGSWVWYEYKEENLDNVENKVNEKNRFSSIAKFSNKHIKRIKYGNKTAKYFETSPYLPLIPNENEKHFFDLVFDYGDYDIENPSLENDEKTVKEQNGELKDTWRKDARPDAFSSYRSCFEMRTYRLCQRVLMFHNFSELGDKSTLVRSINFSYNTPPVENKQLVEVTYLTQIEQKGHIKGEDNKYSEKSLPPMAFQYQELNWNTKVKDVSNENLIHAPVGLSGNYQWTDLYNEGINGILTEQANAWFYKSNLGNGEFSQAALVMPKPSFMGLGNGTLQLQDLDANGEKQLVVNSGGVQGYFELSDDGEWQPFKSFLKTLNLDLKNPNVRMLDVNGDGKPEVVLSDEGAFWFWENEGKIGYDAPELATKPYDEEHGAAIVFSDQEQRIFLADMSGDGMTDIVRIRNGEVCYWANMGYGRFAPKVTMQNSPIFDHSDMFNPSYIQLADISGTGATDIIYLGKNQFKAYLNCSGNSWTKGEKIDPFFPTEQPNKITVTDLLGNGTACIVWSSEMPAYSAAPMRYIDLMGGKKPHIMQSHENGMGKTTTVEYKSSTYFYLKDKLAGTPWITKLPFPVQVVSKTIITEGVTNVRFTAQYSYHHGYYDHVEREFRGFGRVEQTDTEEFEVTNFANLTTNEHHQPPVLTKTWFHTGAFLDRERILNQFKHEYWYKNEAWALIGVSEYELPDAQLLAADNLGTFDINSISAEEWREALRACKGMTLRQEVFGLDAKKRIVDEKAAKNYADNDPAFLTFQDEAKQKELIPYNVATHNCEIQLIQARGKNRYASFIVKESEAITFGYERDQEDPRIAHTLNLETDELGNLLESVSVVYPRKKEEPLLQNAPSDSTAILNAKQHGREGQQKTWITFTKNAFTNDILTAESYYLRRNWQTETYQLTGATPTNITDGFFRISEFKNQFNTFTTIPYQQAASIGKEKRLIEHIKTKFYDANLQNPLAHGLIAERAIPFEAYQLAYTPDLINDIFTPSAFSHLFQIDNADMVAAKYLQDNGNWWIQSGTVLHKRGAETLNDIKNRFFAPIGYIDPFDSETEVFYDTRNLFMQRALAYVNKATGIFNETKVLRFNYRTLSPDIMQDANRNVSSILLDEIGIVKASSIEGKAGANPLQGIEADNLDGLNEFTDAIETALIQAFFTAANTIAPLVCDSDDLQTKAKQLLGNATARMVYDFSKKPTVIATIAREQHHAVNPNSPVQISFEYTDGFGKVAMKKVQAEAGEVKIPDGTKVNTNTKLRWIGNGRTVLNNKGNPIKQYEPYFSTTPAFEDDPLWVEQGVSVVLYYDGAGRNIRTEQPNKTFTKVVFDAWKQLNYDVNDTIKDSEWYEERIALASINPEHRAAKKSEVHHDTPSCIILDSLGRPTLGIDHNKWIDALGATQEEKYYTFSSLDIEGNALNITDARGNVVMAWRYDMLGHRVMQTSMDAGKRWMFNDAVGKSIQLWDKNERQISDTQVIVEERLYRFDYDKLHRPTAHWLSINGAAAQQMQTIRYGENNSADIAANLCGQVKLHQDSAGQMQHKAFDFKGNLLHAERQLIADEKTALINWASSPSLGTDIFTKKTEYDALNRMARLYNWYANPNRVAVYEPTYSVRGTLQSERLISNAQKTATSYTGGTATQAIRQIAYDEKGQRERVQYGNNTTTRYLYDDLTSRLMQLRTTRANINPDFPNGIGLKDTHVLQNLYYTYDPVGNITEIYDDAYEIAFFNNQAIQSKSEYQYDALYRLKEAKGREQIGLNTAPQQAEIATISTNFPVGSAALRNYTQQYHYDSVGNIMKMQHLVNGAGAWTRNYTYAASNNRLLKTQTGDSNNENIDYQYDTHGNMLNVQNIAALAQQMRWDQQDMLQSLNCLGGGNAYYQYDGEKQRTRKYIVRNDSSSEERIYLEGYELYRRKNAAGTIIEEIETYHLFDDKQRLLIVENVIASSSGATILYRYQYSNHLGSAAVETDDNANILSYEEYHPYGTAAYRAKSATITAAAKRYRYTGMERDEESGLNYHSARYYVVWLGRWASVDPIGIIGIKHDNKKSDKIGKEEKHILSNFINQDKIAYNEESIPNLFFSQYNYAENNPVIYVDTNGEEIVLSGTRKEQKSLLRHLQQLTNDKLVVDRTTGIVTVSKAGTQNKGKTLTIGTSLISGLITKTKSVTISIGTDPGGGSAHPASKTRLGKDDWTKATNGTGDNATVIFDPTANPQILTENPKTGNVENKPEPDKIALAHELIHVTRIFTGGISFDKDNYTYQTAAAIPAKGKTPARPAVTVTQNVVKEELRTVGLKGVVGSEPTENDIRKEHKLNLRGAY